VGLEAEAKGAVLGMAEETFVILAFVFVRDFAAGLEEEREEMRRVG
jgi:hypothetical protein